MTATSPIDAVDRLAELKRLGVMDTAEEQAYDDITRLAATTCGTPMALITLVDDRRAWFKSRIGLQDQETPRETSFCAVAICSQRQTFVISDTLAHPGFAGNALVTGEPKIRFYAGALLITAAGHPIGTLCVLDTQPRQLEPHQLEDLRFLARQVVAMLEIRAQAEAEAER